WRFRSRRRSPGWCARSRSRRDRPCRRETRWPCSTEHAPEAGMSVELIRELYDYHRWANRRLFDVAAAGLGDAVSRDMGEQWSVPTVKGMFTHLCSADLIWLSRWNGVSPTRMLSDADVPTLADLRVRWDAVEADQRAFVEGLNAADLVRQIAYRNTEGAEFKV